MEQIISANSRNRSLIIVVSALIPLVVAVLILLPQKIDAGRWVYVLPDLNAVINSFTACLLIAALILIKRGQIEWHRNLMLAAVTLGFVFLVSYVIYHSSVSSVKFGDLDNDGVLSAAELASVEGSRTTYLFVLLSHIVLSAVVVPLVLFALYFALTAKLERHKKLVKWAYPIWLYVSVTGVVVYLMISPYYPWK